MVPQPVHPFPARMAPEIALAQCELLPKNAIVLDPMAGSGTVLRAASERGLRAIGFDTDPLAVLISRVWTTPLDLQNLRLSAERIVEEAQRAGDRFVSLPWIDNDPPTREFVDYWFGPRQQAELRLLAATLHTRIDPTSDALRVALSRIIITKDRGASLGRDVSHSRPHRVMNDNDFPVLREFRRSVEGVCKRLGSQSPPGNVTVHIGDARNMHSVSSHSIDAVITSPPYLNALDYIRGHRLSLVWMGHRVGDLRSVRAESIGAERGPSPSMSPTLINALLPALGDLSILPGREQRMISRYLHDLATVLAEIRRVLKPGGLTVFVVGNSRMRNIFVDNASAVVAASQRVGLLLVDRNERELPPSRRYLPPPIDELASNLAKRMRTEVVLCFSG